jgi:hypothetical protein
MKFERRRGQNEKKPHFAIQKMYFCYSFFWVGPLALHFKDDL